VVRTDAGDKNIGDAQTLARIAELHRDRNRYPYEVIAHSVIDLRQETLAIPECEGRIDPTLCSNLGRLHIG
jgi:hypothetical protein